MADGTAWNFIFFSALFSYLTKSMSEVLKRNLLLDMANTMTMAKMKPDVFIMAFGLKKGISELLTVRSSNCVMPKTIPLWKKPPKSIPVIKAPVQVSRFSVMSRESIVDFLYPNNA